MGYQWNIAVVVVTNVVSAAIALQDSCPASVEVAGQCDQWRAKAGSGVSLMQRQLLHSEVLAPIETTDDDHSWSDEEVGIMARSPGDYDCNGDGIRDCGRWDYKMGMCHNQIRCGHFYKFPDITLDMSCRCRKCSDPAYDGTAYSDKVLTNPEMYARFQAMGWGRFKNWADHLDTCSPWLMPRTDADLQEALKYSRERGYRVRISGAGHSAGGLVTDGKDHQALVLSLAEYVAPGEWEFGSRILDNGSMRATVNAGWTQFHLYERVRPLGYFLPAQTAGYFFALGGIVANSVHGGSYLAGFVHSYATRLRVMNWNGEIRVVDSEEEMRYWRCSFGLLGIILGIEFQLEKREQLQMYAVTEELPNWSPHEFWKFIKHSAEADLPDEKMPKDGGSGGSRKSWNGEYFLDFINGGDTPRIAVYAQKANASVDMDFKGALGIPEKIERHYAVMKNKRVKDDWHGRMSWGEAARRDGAPPIKIMGADVNDILDSVKRHKLRMAKTMSSQALISIPNLVKKLSNKVNDGFFLTHSPAALAAAYFVKPSEAFASMDFLRKVQMESTKSKEFVWNLPGEFRFINVQDSAMLQPVPPGIWFNTQMIGFADLAKNDQSWKREFMKVEEHWVKNLGARPHMGKLFGFSEVGGEVEPFADSYSCTIYSSEVKKAFNEYRQKQDPHGLFASGLGMKFLVDC